MVRSACDPPETDPTRVRDQSIERMSAPISPPPAKTALPAVVCFSWSLLMTLLARARRARKKPRTNGVSRHWPRPESAPRMEGRTSLFGQYLSPLHGSSREWAPERLHEDRAPSARRAVLGPIIVVLLRISCILASDRLQRREGIQTAALALSLGLAAAAVAASLRYKVRRSKPRILAASVLLPLTP